MKTHCCDEMKTSIEYSCKIHKNEYDCPDSLISFVPQFDEYRLIIHDGGRSGRTINYCPWCGSKLETKRDLWFKTLEKLGFENPLDEQIPNEFYSDAWYNQ